MRNSVSAYALRQTMFKILMGLILIVVGCMLSFIPPFIFGIPVLIFATGMIMKGLGRTAVQAAKGGAALASHLKDDGRQAR